MADAHMDIVLVDGRCDANALAQFLVRNLTTEYISHGELQGYRALAPDAWAPDAASVLRREIAERMSAPSDWRSAESWKGVFAGRRNGALVAISFVTFSRAAAVPYGVVEDIVVDERHRGEGLGEYMMGRIMDDLRGAGIRRVFLESGRDNGSAHRLFERLGFKTLSIVMMRDL